MSGDTKARNLCESEDYPVKYNYPIQVKQFVLDVNGTEVIVNKQEILDSMPMLPRDGDLPYVLRRFYDDDDLLRAVAIKLATNLKN